MESHKNPGNKFRKNSCPVYGIPKHYYITPAVLRCIRKTQGPGKGPVFKAALQALINHRCFKASGI